MLQELICTSTAIYCDHEITHFNTLGKVFFPKSLDHILGHKSDLIPSTAIKTVLQDAKNRTTTEPDKISESLQYGCKTNVHSVQTPGLSESIHLMQVWLTLFPQF